ncbi:MAG TPA: PucR family transcriptional regulator ligand-binding domain-containing protein, partial [Chloroflexota bacterium]|nr:PucR family transcriptional regulator ligand-binding domain-containing protein [Chloroflexota bacterium]
APDGLAQGVEAGPTRDAVTVAEVYRVLLSGSGLRGGAGGLARRVTWATTLRSRPPAFEPHGGGEFVLAPAAALEGLRQVEPSLSLARMLEGLAQAGAAAVAVLAPVAADAAAVADTLDFPLIELAPTTSLVALERGIIGLVLNRHNELQAQASNFYRHLAQLSVENRGIEAIIREAAASTGRLAAFEDARFHLRTVAAPPGASLPHLDGAGLSSVDERGRLSKALRSHPVSTMTPVATLIPAARWGMVRYAAPVVTRERVRGFVSLCAVAGPSGEGGAVETEGLTEFDQLAASRTAAILAIELVKEDAVQAAERRIQGDLVDELLHPTADPQATARRAAQAGLSAEGTFAVFALALDEAPADSAITPMPSAAVPTEALADGVNRHFLRSGLPALLRVAAGELVVICQVTGARTGGRSHERPEDAERALRSVGEALFSVLHDHGFSGVTIGASRPQAALADLPPAAREATEALRIGRSVYGPGRLVAYGDLGLYRVLHALRDSPELR